ncbi:MAG: cellulase family glycosylhydrolase [Nanoarchaeota archaeon]|jgi:hypothetical protein|nr:cellulase family glycosylhydrolase [Nanoarchaeota archaeon]
MLSKLYAKENKIMKDDKEFQIKGISINSPGLLIEEGHEFLQDIREIKKLGANAIMVPICPAYFQSMENYCEDVLDSIVDLCEELNLYCSLDWHAQGSPYTDETREYGNKKINGFNKYDARKSVAIDALIKLSKRYGRRKNVIFEAFSMPMNISNKHQAEISQEFVDVIRKNSENIVIVNGTCWTTDLSWVLERPVKSENIVYGFVYYPLKMCDDLEVVLKVKERYPVISPEAGYKQGGYFHGTREGYGEKLKKYILEEGISFFAWCYHPTRVPVVLNSWDPEDLSDWGLFLRDEFL